MEKSLGNLKSLFILVSTFLLYSASSYAESLNPLLPIPTNSGEIPFVAETLRNPELAQRQLTDEIDTQRVEQDSTALETELNTAQGARRIEILEHLYENQQLLAAYFEDILPSKDATASAPINSQLRQARSSIIRFASEVTKLTRDSRTSARAIYAMASVMYVNGDSPNQKILQKTTTSLSSGLQKRSLWLQALLSRSEKAIKNLQSSIGARGQVAGALFLAKFESNNNRYLSLASSVASRLKDRDRDRAFAAIIGAWKARQRGPLDWSKSPASLGQLRGLSIGQAISERIALQAVLKGQCGPALTFYRQLASNSLEQTRAPAVYARILDIELIEYKTKRNAVAYEKALLSLNGQTSEGVTGSPNSGTDIKAQIQQRYRQLVSQLISDAKLNRTGRPERSVAIRVSKNYLSELASEGERIGLKTEIAGLYVLNQQHGEAVRIYRELQKSSQGDRAQQYLLLAMKSQRQLSKWPESAPWNGVAAGSANERNALAKMYGERYEASKNWDDLAHLGLIQIQLSRPSVAYQLWTDALNKNSQGPQAQLAGGMMLMTYHIAHQWQKLEDMSRLSLKIRLNPIFRNRNVDTNLMLADALFEGGKEHFAANRNSAAHTRLAEFVRNYRNDNRRPEGMFVLGKAYHADQKHTKSIESMYALVNEYPQGTYEHDALLLGGSWAMPMAWEDQTIFFYQRFADRYSRDQKISDIRNALVNLYMGRELYGNAVRVYAAQAEDRQIAREDRLHAALAVMNIEERYGEAKQAYWGVIKARELGSNNSIVMAQTLSFEARQAAAQNDLPKVGRIEQQLSKLELNDQTVVEALARTRFVLAEGLAEKTKQEIFNLEQKDPYQTLSQQYVIFNRARQAYDSVCAPGASSYCGLAMLRLSEITRYSLSSIENLSIAQTLDTETVKRFERQKLAVIATITQAANKADSMAMTVADQGETLPEWSKEIVVNNSADELSGSHGAIGNDYVQWLPVKATVK